MNALNVEEDMAIETQSLQDKFNQHKRKLKLITSI